MCDPAPAVKNCKKNPPFSNQSSPDLNGLVNSALGTGENEDCFEYMFGVVSSGCDDKQTSTMIQNAHTARNILSCMMNQVVNCSSTELIAKNTQIVKGDVVIGEGCLNFDMSQDITAKMISESSFTAEVRKLMQSTLKDMVDNNMDALNSSTEGFLSSVEGQRSLQLLNNKKELQMNDEQYNSLVNNTITNLIVANNRIIEGDLICNAADVDLSQKINADLFATSAVSNTLSQMFELDDQTEIFNKMKQENIRVAKGLDDLVSAIFSGLWMIILFIIVLVGGALIMFSGVLTGGSGYSSSSAMALGLGPNATVEEITTARCHLSSKRWGYFGFFVFILFGIVLTILILMLTRSGPWKSNTPKEATKDEAPTKTEQDNDRGFKKAVILGIVISIAVFIVFEGIVAYKVTRTCSATASLATLSYGESETVYSTNKQTQKKPPVSIENQKAKLKQLLQKLRDKKGSRQPSNSRNTMPSQPTSTPTDVSSVPDASK